MGIPDVLTPTWPPTYDRWESVIALLIIAVLKSVRGTIMKRQATSVDRLGWSIILWDLVFAGVAFLQVFWTFYPGALLTPWFTRISTAVVAVFALWQLYEVLIARQERIERAVSADPQPNWKQGDPERRVGLVDRRREGRIARGLES